MAARPPGTTGRPDVLVGNRQYLYYGNYNGTINEGAHIYRSADDGTTWTEVLSVPDARHVHAIGIDPLHPEHILAELGDKGRLPPEFPGYGLWFSESNGDPGTFIHLSSDNDGIDMVFHELAGFADDLIIEGDGPDAPMILIFRRIDVPVPGPSQALVEGDPSPPDGKGSLEGTGRCIALTTEGNLFWASKAEGAPDRHRAGIWMAKGPFFAQSVLLEEVPPQFTPSAKTLEVGPYLFFSHYRILKPSLHLQ